MNRRSKLLTLVTAGICSVNLMAEVKTPVSPAVDQAILTYKDVEDIIVDNCVFCHTGADALGAVALDTEADLVSQAKKTYAAIDSGFMPSGDPNWRNTADGQKLLQYLKAQIPAE
jgi:uncharacterized membrane protein